MRIVHTVGLTKSGSERRAIHYLSRSLRETPYVLFHNLEISAQSGETHEYDIVLVGNGAIYSLEIKDYHGIIRGDGRRWTMRNREVERPFRLARVKAMILARRLHDYSPVLKRVFVEPLIVITGEQVRTELRDTPTDYVVLLENVPKYIQRPLRRRISHDEITDFTDVVVEAILAIANLRLYSYDLSLPEHIVTETPLSPNYLAATVTPYLRAIENLARIINEIKGQESRVVAIRRIAKYSPLSLSLDGASEAVQTVRDVVVPWRRKHAEKMAQLIEREKFCDIEIKRAEVLARRAQAEKDRRECERLSAEAMRQREEAERLKIENERLRFELERDRIQLALDVLAQIGVEVDETQKISYVVKLLSPLNILTTNELAPPAETMELEL